MSKTFVEPTMTEALILWAIITLVHSIITYALYRIMGNKHLEKNTKEIMENHIDPDEEIIDIEQGAIPKSEYLIYGPAMNFCFAGFMLLFWKAVPGLVPRMLALLMLSVVFFFYHFCFFKFFIKLRKKVIVFTNKSFVIFLEQSKIKKILLNSIEECRVRYSYFLVYYKNSFGKRKKNIYLATKITWKIANYIHNKKV